MVVTSRNDEIRLYYSNNWLEACKQHVLFEWTVVFVVMKHFCNVNAGKSYIQLKCLREGDVEKNLLKNTFPYFAAIFFGV